MLPWRYDVGEPAAPRFAGYFNNRDFSSDTEADTAGDLAPEGIVFWNPVGHRYQRNSLVYQDRHAGSDDLLFLCSATGDVY